MSYPSSGSPYPAGLPNAVKRSKQKQYLDYLKRQIQITNIEVKLHTDVNKEYVKSFSPDVLIVACGANPYIPDIPGIHGSNVKLASRLNSYDSLVGNSVFVIGGGSVGCEEGLALARMGKSVTIAEMTGKLASDAPVIHWKSLMQEIKAEPHLSVLLNTRCTKVEPHQAWVVDSSGVEKPIHVDVVLLASGLQSDHSLISELSECAPEFRFIGDCSSPGTVRQAVSQGYYAALDC